MKQVIVTADDFGISLAANEAIERAYREGILTTTSLMVAAPATADAVARAREIPRLAVGLHIVLVRGRPMLPPELIPDLVGRDGNFRENLFSAGLNFFFRPIVRRQLDAEIRAQFDAFRQTGLALDHVNCHNHLQLHPSILASILAIGADYGLRAMRLPSEPFVASWRAARFGGFLARLAYRAALRPWTSIIEARLRRAGIVYNDHIFGMYDSGQMTGERLKRLIAALPNGISELHCHPSTQQPHNGDPAARNYRHVEEFEALIDPAIARAFDAQNIERIAFRDLTQHNG